MSVTVTESASPPMSPASCARGEDEGAASRAGPPLAGCLLLGHDRPRGGVAFLGGAPWVRACWSLQVGRSWAWTRHCRPGLPRRAGLREPRSWPVPLTGLAVRQTHRGAPFLCAGRVLLPLPSSAGSSVPGPGCHLALLPKSPCPQPGLRSFPGGGISLPGPVLRPLWGHGSALRCP